LGSSSGQSIACWPKQCRVVKVMNGYFSAMSAPIHQRGGVIDKYIGDASWPIGGRHSPPTPIRRGSPDWPRSMEARSQANASWRGPLFKQ
jgi:class 3 adenylate cyclase